MIPVVPKVPEPDAFKKGAKVKGSKWLAANPGSTKRPPAYWADFTRVLSDGFRNLCGYGAMLDPTGGTIDHYISYKTDASLAYDWDNYRFASATLNSSKKTADDTVLDPYEVQEGWFEILLPSLQMQVVASAVPDHLKDKAEFTLKRLKLRDGERVLRWRRSWYELYCNGQLTLDGLRRVAPLIAKAVENQSSGV